MAVSNCLNLKTNIMEKEQYLKELKELNDSMDSLKNKLRVLKTSYIADNSNFKIGDKVKIVSPPHPFFSIGGKKVITSHSERFAYVDGFEIDYNKDVVPTLKKAKKDGSISQHKDWFNSNNSHIEKV